MINLLAWQFHRATLRIDTLGLLSPRYFHSPIRLFKVGFQGNKLFFTRTAGPLHFGFDSLRRCGVTLRNFRQYATLLSLSSEGVRSVISVGKHGSFNATFFTFLISHFSSLAFFGASFYKRRLTLTISFGKEHSTDCAGTACGR